MNSRFRAFLNGNGAAFLFLTALSLLLTWPALLYLRDRVIGDYPGDNFHFLWELWYVAHATFDLHKNPLFDPDIYVPFGFDLIKNQDLSPGTVLLFMPLTRLIGEVATYNLLIISSFALTAFGAFLLAKELWQNRAGASFAAISIAFCAYRYTHSGGHLSIVSTQWILFFFLYFERTLKNPTAANGILAGIFFGLCAWVTWYYAWTVPIAALLYLAVRVDWSRPRSLFPVLRAGAFAIGVALLLILPFAIPYARATSSGAMAPRSLGEAQTFAASVADYFIPSIGHPLWGDWVRQHWRNGANGAWLSEWELYLGLPTMILALLGALRASPRRLVWALLAVAFGSFVISLGPSLHLLHPSAVSAETNDSPLSHFLLPGLLLNKFPPFSLLRSWARLGFFVEIAVALLAAGGVAYLAETLKTQRPAVPLAMGVILVAALVFDTLEVPVPNRAVNGSEVERWLARQSAPAIVMEFPVPNNAYSGPAMYFTRLTGKRIVMGYASYPPNASYFPTLAGFPSSNSLDLLESWGVTYILVDANLYRPGSVFQGVKVDWSSLAAAISATPRLKELVTLDGVHVYQLEPEKFPALGPELLSNSSFESLGANGPAGWSAQGRPRVDSAGTRAHRGRNSSLVTSSDYFVSAPIPVDSGSCYLLQAWSHRDPSKPATLSLELIWLDERRNPLPFSTSTRDEIDLGEQWLAEKEVFRAPLSGRYATVRAAAGKGQVRVDDYSFRQVSKCDAALSAIPNPVKVSPGGPPAAFALSWDSHTGEDTRVALSIGGGAETPYATGPKETRIVSPLITGATYEFRLYASSRSRQPLKTLQVSTKTLQLLRASPVQFSPNVQTGSTVISWDLPAGAGGEVFVSVNSQPENLFARGDSGSQEAAWISKGVSYEFRLYRTINSRQLVAKILLKE